MKQNTSRRTHTSGSPATWSAKRKAYKATQGPVSNPGNPSKVNRKTRRKDICTCDGRMLLPNNPECRKHFPEAP